MSREASESKTAIQPPSRAAEAATYLAPGFRFHPTEEELISYYLKRKVTGRPIRVDAISEIDLYRVEPWDLPHWSRLRSRDLEWYFFTSLDRKYSNRCRTNRATAEGYWKTTGKDRPIQRGSRTIGMKKTLVYHAGRAPRGQRTNWVMHEYRLEDEELARAGISQDGYVLCRVFQKNGSGPQNGAQYGAPFIEEEWEREEVDVANLVPVNLDRDSPIDPAAQDFVQLGDFLQNPDSGNQHMDALPPEERTASDNQTEDSSIFVEDILNDLDSFEPAETDFSVPHDNNTSFKRPGEKIVLEEASVQSKGYVQLKDLFIGDGTNRGPNPTSNHYLLAGFNNGVTNQLDRRQRCPVLRGTFQQPFSPSGDVPWECLPSQLVEDNLVYYDALSHEIPYSEDGFAVDASLSPLNEFDLSEDLMSFYDAPNDHLLFSPKNQFPAQCRPHDSYDWIESNASPEVIESSTCASKEVFHVPDSLAKMASSGMTPVNSDGLSTGFHGGLSEDIKAEEDCKDRTLTKRLASMLHSISAPPAFADESGLTGKGAAQTSSGSSLHLAAGMIRVDNWTAAMGYAESWTLEKRSELGFFAYGINASMISRVAGCRPRNKFLGWGGLHLFFLSAIMLALSYKVGVYVYHL